MCTWTFSWVAMISTLTMRHIARTLIQSLRQDIRGSAPHCQKLSPLAGWNVADYSFRGITGGTGEKLVLRGPAAALLSPANSVLVSVISCRDRVFTHLQDSLQRLESAPISSVFVPAWHPVTCLVHSRCFINIA